MYEAGKLCQLPRTKLGLLSGRVECSSCNFKGLRGLSSEEVGNLLDQVIAKKIPLKKLSLDCKRIKDMKNMKLEFVKQTGVKSWEEAKQTFPHYACEDKLRELKALDSKNSPTPQFLAYCRKALTTKNCRDSLTSCSLTKIYGEVTVKCALFDFDNLTDIAYSNLCACIPGFPGFSLIVGSLGSKFAVSHLLI